MEVWIVVDDVSIKSVWDSQEGAENHVRKNMNRKCEFHQDKKDPEKTNITVDPGWFCTIVIHKLEVQKSSSQPS